MGRVVLRSNRLGEIARRLPGAIEQAVQDSAQNLRDTLEPQLWERTGVIRSTADATGGNGMHATVGVGHESGRGFYAGFQEWGTSKQAPRPVVGPAGHAHEPVFARDVGDAVKRVAR